MKNNIPVYSSKLAKILCNKGYHIIDLAINKTNNKSLVFFFENREEIWRVIKDYESITKQYKQRIKEQLKGVGFDEEKRDNPKD
jgi:hypothetical protein